MAILVPAYGGADRLRACLASLIEHAPPECRIFVLDDGTPDQSIAECCREQARENITYVRSAMNRGFVATCNWGWAEIAPPHSDILLLNSDTEVTAGFLEEMLRVLYLDERHGAVTPRSNNATIFSIPPGSSGILPEEAYRIWEEIRFELPEYRIMPTAVGFCMLVKAIILERFGLFDEIYSPGYNEENDFICRINRRGFSAVAANRAFVHHYESSTFGSRRKALEREHRKILLERFPEYDRKVSEYLEYDVDPVEKFSILRRKHRPAILFDLFHLPAKYSGTSELALNLLREVHTLMEKDCDLYVGVTEEGRFFASELNGYRLFEERPGSEMLFDLVFKPSQFFRWSEFRRMNRLAPRLSFVLLDIIAVRCDYLSSVQRTTMFEKTVALADQVYTLSHFSRSDFQAYFGTECPAHVIHLGTDSGLGSAEAIRGEYVLVVGNSYAHKGIKDALPYLTEVGPVRVMGGEKPAENSASHIRWMASGAVTRGSMRELYAKASVLVYPSLYEGYGLPIVDALAVGKPVVAIDSEVNRELAAALNTASFTLVPSFRDLKEVVANKVRESADNPPDAPVRIRRWRDVAEEYVASFRELLERPPNIRKLRDRHDLIRVLNAARHP